MKSRELAKVASAIGLVSLGAGCSVPAAHPTRNVAPDKYRNFAELAAKESEGVDYRISLERRGSPISVLAIHGGFIDLDTSKIARAVAGEDLNLYLFEGIKRSGNWDLHVTSSHFDEPRALEFASASQSCVSIHGHKHATERICVGGRSQKLRARMTEAFQQATLPFQVTFCEEYDGADPTNIVNRCQGEGVQLEFSSALRTRLNSNPELLSAVARTIRGVLLDGNLRSR